MRSFLITSGASSTWSIVEKTFGILGIEEVNVKACDPRLLGLFIERQQQFLFFGSFFSLFIRVPDKLKGVILMGEIRGVVGKEAENKFRRLAMKKFGYRKGSLSKALEEALFAWIEKCEDEKLT